MTATRVCYAPASHVSHVSDPLLSSALVAHPTSPRVKTRGTMSTATRDTVSLRLRKSLYQFVQDACVAARVSTDNWPRIYEDDDEVNAATAEGFIAERLGAFQRGIEQQRQEAKKECDKSICKGSEAMNALVKCVGGGEADCALQRKNTVPG